MYQLDKSKAYNKIVELLSSGEIAPGSKLSERKVSEMIGMGRVPVREALKELQYCGIIEVNPAKGSFFKIGTLEELQNTYEVRAILEVAATVLAAQKHQEGSLDEFENNFHYMLENHQQLPIEQVDLFCSHFHELLLELAQNPILLETFKPFKLKNAVLFKLPENAQQQRNGLNQEILAEHLAILEAVKQRNIESCRALMRAHLQKGYEIRKQYLKLLEHPSE